MATRAEWFRYQQERSGPKKVKSEPRVPRDGVPASHNLSERAGRKASYALEDSPGARPSRKSTRKASNRQKTDAQFRMKRATAEARQAERPRAGR
jgi:hypothetical protein